MPPASRRILTPEIVVEIWKSDCVTSRAQPPPWMRLGAMLKEFQNIGISPPSVAGGLRKDGKLLASAGFCGPGSVTLWALALIAPCGGKSGLPNDSAPL